MIIGCPRCTTRFRVADAALVGAAGRRVRCANCGHLWHYRIEPPPILGLAGSEPAAVAASVRLPAVAARPDGAAPRSASEVLAIEALGLEIDPRRSHVPSTAPPRVEPRVGEPWPDPRAFPARREPPNAPVVAAQRQGARTRPWRLIAAGASALTLATAILFVGIFARETIMANWPSTAGAYALLDLAGRAGPSAVGLEVTLTPTRSGDALVIDGDILNSAAAARRIPRLKVMLRDRHEVTVVSREIDPPVAALPPGATAHFNTVFEHPSRTATDVAVSFASD